MSMPKLTLCINTHNEGPDVLQTILSVRNHYSGPFEAVVVADATTDNSMELIKDYDAQDGAGNKYEFYGEDNDCECTFSYPTRSASRRAGPCSECLRQEGPMARPFHESFGALLEAALTRADVLRLAGPHQRARYEKAIAEDFWQAKREIITERDLYLGESTEELLGYSLTFLDVDDNAYVKIIRNKERQGCGKCKQQAIAAATGDVILHMDGHCRVLRGDLDEMVQAAADNEWIVCPGVAPLHCPQDGQPSADDSYCKDHTCYGGKISKTAKGYKVGPGWKPKKGATARRTATWYAIFMMGRKTLVNRLGGWNAFPHGWGSQEIGLALRAWFADVPIYAFKNVICGHRYQDDRAHKDYQSALRAKGIKHYPNRQHGRKANHMYSHRVVFDPETVAELWDPLWADKIPSEQAPKLLDESELAAQAADFRARCKRKTDAEFFAEFGCPTLERNMLPLDQITAVLLAYRRPKGTQKAVDALRKLGITKIWVWCNEGAEVPTGASRVFTDTDNGVTWPRYAIASLAETPWVLFLDDDVVLYQTGLDALRKHALDYPNGNLGLLGKRFDLPKGTPRSEKIVRAPHIQEPVEVDIIWPKGQLIGRDLAQTMYGETGLWQAMRLAVRSTSGDDMIAGVIQQAIGAPPALIVPSQGKAYKEGHTEGKQFALTRQAGRQARKLQSRDVWKAMGWRPVIHDEGWAKPDPVMAHFILSQTWGALASQHPHEMREVWDLIEPIAPRVFLEIGSYRGGTAWTYAQACERGATIICIDKGDRGPKGRTPFKRTVKNLEAWGFDVHWLRLNSHDQSTLDEVQRILAGRRVDFLHIDGDHKVAGVTADWEMYGPLVRPGGFVAFHDIRSNDPRTSVPKVWPSIKEGRKFYEFFHGDWPGRKQCGIGVIEIEGQGDAE